MKYIAAILAIVVVLLGANSMYTVREGQQAMLLQFGRIVDAEVEPGLHFKLPFLQQVEMFDSRILSLNVQPERYFTAEKKSVDVDFYVKWRIDKVADYYRATAGQERNANQRLTPIVKDALRFEFNSRPLEELISGARGEITKQVLAQANKSADSLGIEVVDVRIKRIDLPDEVSESVYNRMRAERLNLANRLRSTGKEIGETIRAEADRKVQVLLAEARGEAARVRGEGDAQAAQIFAAAYSQDPEFYAFYRSLDAYRESFKGKDSVLILQPDSGFLDYFDGKASE